MKKFEIGSTFGVDLGLGPDGKPVTMEIDGLENPHAWAPEKKPYKFRLGLLRDMIGFHLSGDIAMFLIGHTGTGKSSLVEQFYAHLNMPLVVVNASPRMESADLLGRYLPQADGTLGWRDGPLTMAMRNGWPFLIDEFNLMDPGEAVALNNVLEGRPLLIEATGELVRPAAGFKVFATSNPEVVGVTFGRKRRDATSDDRFWFVEVPYMTPEEEAPIVQQTLSAYMEDADVASQYARSLCDVADRVRKQFMGLSDADGALEITISSRTLHRWAKLMGIFQRMGDSVHYALERSLTNRASPESKLAVHSIVEEVFGVPWSGGSKQVS